MENIDNMNLIKAIGRHQGEWSAYYCKNLLCQLVELSKIYDVIIDNGKVILSEKS